MRNYVWLGSLVIIALRLLILPATGVQAHRSWRVWFPRTVHHLLARVMSRGRCQVGLLSWLTDIDNAIFGITVTPTNSTTQWCALPTFHFKPLAEWVSREKSILLFSVQLGMHLTSASTIQSTRSRLPFRSEIMTLSVGRVIATVVDNSIYNMTHHKWQHYKGFLLDIYYQKGIQDIIPKSRTETMQANIWIVWQTSRWPPQKRNLVTLIMIYNWYYSLIINDKIWFVIWFVV